MNIWQIRLRPSLFAPLLTLFFYLGAPAALAATDACSDLSQAAAKMRGPALLPSYPSLDEMPDEETADLTPLRRTAFVYDNAVTIIALIGCGNVEAARQIGDALLYAQDHDRFWHDGRLRNGYAAGRVGGGPMRLTGWWDQQSQSWFEDRYQAGSDSGNQAWAMLALLALDQATPKNPAYRDGALQLGRWLTQYADETPDSGYRGGTFGHEPMPEQVTWKSTEHNLDLAAAYDHLGAQSSYPGWHEKADLAHGFVATMWQASGCYATGTDEDGKTPNDYLALDAQVWPLLALKDASSHQQAVLLQCLPKLKQGDGYAYGAVLQGIWTEGTAQVALLLKLTGDEDGAGKLMRAIAALRAPDGFYLATDRADLPTGFDLPTAPGKKRLYLHLPHLGATAWVALAERGFNPFTGTNRLP